MIPHPLAALVLALAAFRTYRLLALDTLPPLRNFRSLVVGVKWDTRMGESSHETDSGLLVENDWTVSTPDFKRPLLAEWLSCAWCSGLAFSAVWYAVWLLAPRPTLYAAVPLALSAAVGLLQAALSD